MTGGVLPSVSVCVVTYERATFLMRCLESLASEAADINEVVVVDASLAPMQEATQGAYPGIWYVHAPHLAGWMTRSRNEGLLHVTSDILAFVDDDVVVRPGWAAAMRRAFRDTTAAAVVGRTCNGQPGEETYPKPIGRLLRDGTLTDGFAASVKGRIQVDHGIGANMSFRSAVLAELGGFRDDYPGPALREDTDVFLRIGALGYQSLFDSEVCVDHRPAPHVKGRRFDTRYKLYSRRNHMVLLARHSGITSRLLCRWIATQFAGVSAAPDTKQRFMRLGVVTLGVAWGASALPRSAKLTPMSPARGGGDAQDIRRALTAPAREGPGRWQAP